MFYEESFFSLSSSYSTLSRQKVAYHALFIQYLIPERGLCSAVDVNSRKLVTTFSKDINSTDRKDSQDKRKYDFTITLDNKLLIFTRFKRMAQITELSSSKRS